MVASDLIIGKKYNWLHEKGVTITYEKKIGDDNYFFRDQHGSPISMHGYEVPDSVSEVGYANGGTIKPIATVHARKFTAQKHPKGSEQRDKLNENSLTSEYMTSKKYEVHIAFPETATHNAYINKHSYETKKEAEDIAHDINNSYSKGGTINTIFQNIKNFLNTPI